MADDTNVLDFLKSRILSCYGEAVMLKNGKMPLPRMCILYPTYSCNQNCIGCDYQELNGSNKSFTESEFDNVIGQLISIGIKSVEFCGGGEPTMHPYLPEAIRKLSSNNIAFSLLTNGTNITGELVDLLVKYGSYCRISVEAASREVYSRYKRPASEKSGFENTINNIRRLVEYRDHNREHSRLQISYKYSIDMNNYTDIAKAVDVASQLKVDSIQFKLIRNVPSEIMDESIIMELHNKLEECRKVHPGFKIMGNLFKSKLSACRCWLSPLQMTIDPYGDVYICCYYRHRLEDHKLGNVFRKPLRDVWYSRDHWDKMSRINTEECNKYDCRFHHYNEVMNSLVIRDETQLLFI